MVKEIEGHCRHRRIGQHLWVLYVCLGERKPESSSKDRMWLGLVSGSHTSKDVQLGICTMWWRAQNSQHILSSDVMQESFWKERHGMAKNHTIARQTGES